MPRTGPCAACSPPSRRTARYAYVLLVAITAVLIGCSSKRQVADPDSLRVAVLPDDAPEALRERHAPLLAYLADRLKRRFELIIPQSYEEFGRDTEAGRYDLAYLGGYTFVRARQRSGYVPVAMRDVDTRFVSYFLVRQDDPAQTIMDL